MSDIDFVELDKAVNNLVNKNNAKLTAAMPQPVGQPVEPTNQVGHKPSGRFMDVFHHSSDMMGKNADTTDKTDASAIQPPRKVLNPIYNDIKTPAKTSEPSKPFPEHADESFRKNDWPDPIDAAVNEASHLSSEESPKEAASSPVDASSLFLPDTKVEKRPLGGFSADNIQDEDKTDDKEEASPASTTAPIAELPPELGADLVAIEEGGSVFHATDSSHEDEKTDTKEPDLDLIEDEDDKPNEPSIREDLSQPSSTVSRHDEPAEPETTPPHKTELSGLLAAGSIPQQYKTTAVATSQPVESTHPIFFDADQYNKAPDPGAHKKSGRTSAFQWIFIIVGLLLLGATLGAALFVFVTNN